MALPSTQYNSGDLQFYGAVRNDAGGPLAGVDDGDYTPLQTDSLGNLKTGGAPTSTDYEYAAFSVGAGVSDYDVDTQQANLFDDITSARKFVLITDTSISLKLNSASKDAINITTSESPYVLENDLAITNAFITNATGGAAGVQITLFN